MAVKTIDVTKGAIMKMLRTDVFGFKPVDIEEQAKEVFNLVSDGAPQRGAKQVDMYVRNENGFIRLTRVADNATKGKKKKTK